MVAALFLFWAHVCGRTEIGVFEDAVSLPGSKVLSDAEEPQAEISAGDEDERVPLQCARYVLMHHNGSLKCLSAVTGELIEAVVSVFCKVVTRVALFQRTVNKHTSKRSNKYNFWQLNPEITQLFSLFMSYLAGFVDVETPTLFKRTPGVSRTLTNTNKLSENGNFESFVSGCQRVCGSIQRARQVLLSTSESTTVQTASDGGWHRQVGNLPSEIKALNSRTCIYGTVYPSILTAPSLEHSRTVKQHLLWWMCLFWRPWIHIVLWSNA